MSSNLDLHTMFVICSSLSVASGICMVLIQLTGRPYPGFGYWTIGVWGQAVAFTLYAYSQELPQFVGSIGGNILYTLYPMFMSRGLRVFAGRRTYALPVALGLIYTLCATYYFSVVHLSPNWRVAFGQVVVIPFFIESAILVWRDPAFRYPIVRHWITGTFVLMVVSSLTRMVLMFVLEPNRLQIWSPSGLQPFYMTLLTGLTLSVSIGVIVLNFQRAAANLEDKERLLTEDVIAQKRSRPRSGRARRATAALSRPRPSP